MTISVFTRGVSVDLLPAIQQRFADHHMHVEFHPSFAFNEQTDTGFLPIRFKLQSGISRHYDLIGYDILTGLELNFNRFDFDEELNVIKQMEQANEKKSLLSRLFGVKKAAEEDIYVADKDLDPLLKECKTQLLLDCHSYNKTTVRIGLLFAAIIAELTNGVIYDPQHGRYLTGSQALQVFPEEIEEYEQSFAMGEFIVEKFEGWR